MCSINVFRKLDLLLIGKFLFKSTKTPTIQLRTAHKMSNIPASDLASKRQRTDGAPLTIGTHDGTFHCDEVLACFMLKQLPEYENSNIFRSRSDEKLKQNCDIIVDVGGESDHEKKLYDHHQKSFQETMSTLRPELGDKYQIRLSSAGLVYCYYGERVINEILKEHAKITLTPDNLKLTYVQIYNNFICEVDAIDNGVPICPNGLEPSYTISTNLSKRVHKFNPNWEEEGTNVNVDARFEEAMSYVGKEFIDKVVAVGGSWIKARDYVRHAIESAKSVHESGEILLLERFCPWKQHLAELENEYNVKGLAKLVIFADTSGNWRVAGVPVTPESYLGRMFLPEPWRGMRDDELSKLTGVDGCSFVHHTGFIGGAKTKEAAIAMAVKSIQWK